jgi:hypothetical protein
MAALRQLLRDPEQALPLVRERLKPLEVDAETRGKVLLALADLDSDERAVRDAAARELEELGTRAEALLLRARGKGAPEQRGRVEALLRGAERRRPLPDRLGFPRAIRLVGRIGTPEAREVLRELTHPDRPLPVQELAAEVLAELQARAGR